MTNPSIADFTDERALVPFDAAFAQLRERFPDTTAGEVVMWVAHSSPFADGADRRDVLPAYRRAVLPDDPEEREALAVHGTFFLTGDAVSSLYKIHELFFPMRALETFEPRVRWLTYTQLTARWRCDENRIAERIEQTGHSPFEFWPHPLRRDAGLSESMFLLEQIETVERRLGVSRALETLPQGEKAPAGSRDNLRLSNDNYRLSPLPQGGLAERARRGLDLTVASIMDLEFPGIPPHEGQRREDYLRWRRLIEMDIHFEVLPVRFETDDDGCLPADEWIARCDYRTWRATQAQPPIDSRIEAVWLAAPTEPNRPKPGAAAKQAALAQLLDELDRRAAEHGAGFDRHSLPGTKEEFARLLKSHCPVFRYIGTPRIADYLKGKCQFQPGAQSDHGKGAVIWALFPEHDLK